MEQIPVQIKERLANKKVRYNLADGPALEGFVYGRLLKAGKIKEAAAIANAQTYKVIDDEGNYL